jgi:16S rRNA (guanine966-N2)-methyltransferase
MTKLSAEGGGMRIIAGQFRGRKLFSPIKSGIRPTTDAVRESIFNILYSASGLLPEPEYQNILDLFAGTGAMGLEALSRNAARALFVDNNPEAHAIIYKNIAMLGVADHAKIYRRSALKLDQWRELYRFNMVFVV